MISLRGHAVTAFHLRHTALPAPGDVRQLKRLAGRILSQEFDRSKPLWETWFVDGLEGDQVAVISKTHHCMADGISGVAMGNLLVGANPEYEPPPPPEWTPRPAPGSARLVADELRHRVTAPLRLLGSSRGEGGGSRSGLRPSGLGGLVGSALRQASDTPLNVPVGPHRRFDWTSLPFDEVRRMGKSAGGTVNDVVLAVATGALREHLQRDGVAVDELDFRAVVPVNVRTAGEDGTLGNRVSELIARLPIDEPDPWSRLLAVVEMTRELKASGQSGAGDLINQAFDLLPTQLLTLLFRLMSGSSVANLIMTNVPGPRVPVGTPFPTSTTWSSASTPASATSAPPRRQPTRTRPEPAGPEEPPTVDSAPVAIARTPRSPRAAVSGSSTTSVNSRSPERCTGSAISSANRSPDPDRAPQVSTARSAPARDLSHDGTLDRGTPGDGRSG